MVIRAIEWFWRRFRPAGGWLPFALLAVTVVLVAASITASDWAAESAVVALTAPAGLVLGVWLARCPLRPFSAWLLIGAYGLALTLAVVARLLPPFQILVQGAGGDYFRRQWSILLDRAGGWFLAAARGGSSGETIMFALLLGLLAWTASAYAGWAVYRQQRAGPALVLLGLIIALNGYFAGASAPLWVAALFMGSAPLLLASLRYASLEREWEENKVDYSLEIRVEILGAAGMIALLVLLLSYGAPNVRLRELANAFRQLEPVQQVEERFDQLFGGVRSAGGSDAFGPGGRGILPRNFLLDGGPSLSETVVMTATVRPAHASVRHWRAASYTIYTGQGWALAEERSEVIAPGETIPLPEVAGETIFTQTVHWQFDERIIRYTIGMPLQFDGTVTTYWHGVDDFLRANGSGSSYTAVSRLATASARSLRQARLDEAPAALLARYSQLPEEVPERVLDLAREIAAPHETAYDQALALEHFLRQYPYSLDVDGPPPGRDPVDYFLFDLQAGYCDYYASAFVVMARGLGLPARLVTGYLAATPDENGVQTLHRIDAHTWPEVYFAGYGWVEFEPTAPFSVPAPDEPAAWEAGEPPAFPEGNVPPPPPIQEAPPRRATWWALAILLPALLISFWLWRRRSRAEADEITDAYGQLLRTAEQLGARTSLSQTPAEFHALFRLRLDAWEEAHPRLGWLLQGVAPAVERLTGLFIARQYGRPEGRETKQREAAQLWRQIRARLWLLALYRRFYRRLSGRSLADQSS